MSDVNLNSEEILSLIHELISLCGGEPTTFEGELVTQSIQNSLKLMIDQLDTGQIKLVTRSIKEMRYAYRIFNKYKGARCVSIFGSARTPEDHLDYLAAKEFSAQIASLGWMCITGAANGIMKAGHEGMKKEQSFGLSIRLPFESSSNAVIEGDPKLISFRYFFTRKLMFMSHSDAMVAFPGGFGTMDELFEMLTLIQTGKANIIPLVLVEGEGGVFWKAWEHYLKTHLSKNGWISKADQSLYYHSKSPEDAVQHIVQFYKRYHSSRYVKDDLVIRLKEALTPRQLASLNRRYSQIVAEGKINAVNAFAEETDHLELPRLAFRHTRRDFGVLRQLIDAINEFHT
jgi:uncharacterized protein (TIGR00730 family)